MPGHAVGSLPGMDQLTVRPCTAAELEQAPAFGALMAEYLAEAGRAITADPAPQIAMYKAQEAAGTMRFAGAWAGGDLVGMMVVALSVVPHFGMTVATTETLFVSAKARKTGAGKALLSLADDMAREYGAVGVLVSAPVGGVLSKVLPRSGFKHTNELFFKALT